MGARAATQVKHVQPYVQDNQESSEDGEGEASHQPRRARDRSQRGLDHRISYYSVDEMQSEVVLHRNSRGGYELEDKLTSTTKPLNEGMVAWFHDRNSETLRGALAFVPWILQQSYREGGGLQHGNIVLHRGSGAVVFSDASGFTALTDRLAKKSNGAELLSQCLTAFYTPLINLVNAYRGDVIKFSGDALMIYFPAVDDTKSGMNMPVPPHGSYGFPDIGPIPTSVLRASACCIEIHKRLHMFDTGVDGSKLCLHIGVGCGEVAILQVGGEVPPETHVPRCEYIIAGPPLEQISIAEPLAKNGETCLSPQAWEHVSDCVEEGLPLEDRPDYHLLKRMNESKFTFPTIKYWAQETDNRVESQFQLSELNIIRRYIPSPVFKQIEGGTLTYVNEMRNISTIFVSGSGVDVSTDEGAVIAQDLMSSVQRMCYSHEGTLNKFVIDDKGMLFLLVYGLPPLVHTDDSTRAVLATFDMVKVFKRLKLQGRFGVTTGRAYCGICGSTSRMEYTVLGDTVNLSARLMSNAPSFGILTCESTRNLSTAEITFEALAPIKVKGKVNPVDIFRPSKGPQPKFIGLGPEGRLYFPWYERPFGGLGVQLCRETGEPQAGDTIKANLIQICGLPQWDGIGFVHNLLGGQFSPDIHSSESCVPSGPVLSTASPAFPEDSPFSEGGVLVIAGSTGTGKIELAEHVIVYTSMQLRILPCIGSMGPRVGDRERLGVELLRSALGTFRHLDPTIPLDDGEALVRLLPKDYMRFMPDIREALAGEECESEKVGEVLDKLVDIAIVLIEMLKKQTAMLIVLQLEIGTSLFAKTIGEFDVFWAMVSKFENVTKAPQDSSGVHPATLMILAKEVPPNHPTIVEAMDRGWYIKTSGLSEEISTEYIARYLNIPRQLLPLSLQQFIYKITLGNALYIRETIDQLIKNAHIKVLPDSLGQPLNVEYHQDLEEVNIAAWSQTAMVGETICLLESLDPLEAAVVKMSTVFTGQFTLPDLASIACSRWAGATYFDQLRLYRAMQHLVDRKIIEVQYDDDSCASAYTLRNVLIRKVGGLMLLEAQKKAMKRQALIDRVLARDLPERMEKVMAKRNEPHIPWYYENILAKS